MAKYYRVIKDTPAWLIGAIISRDSEGDGYTPIEDFWNRVEECTSFYEMSSLVENCPEFFERVYETNRLGKRAYVTKDLAIEQANKLFKIKWGELL